MCTRGNLQRLLTPRQGNQIYKHSRKQCHQSLCSDGDLTVNVYCADSVVAAFGCRADLIVRNSFSAPKPSTYAHCSRVQLESREQLEGKEEVPRRWYGVMIRLAKGFQGSESGSGRQSFSPGASPGPSYPSTKAELGTSPLLPTAGPILWF